MSSELFKLAASQGIWAKLTETFNIIEDVKKDVQEIKSSISKK